MFIEENKESKAIKQFSRFAHQYDTYNMIQAKVANRLVGKLTETYYPCILDIGCGSGEIYKNIQTSKIDFDKFIALDSSSKMLDLHPVHQNIEKISANFNTITTFNQLEILSEETLILSSSALQWSENLDFVFEQLSQKASKAYFAIFTANTFKTLHKVANTHSPIYTENQLKKAIEKYYHATYELRAYKLEFLTIRDMFQYIKKSGVSGGERQLGYRETKQLMNNYPLTYLEFEVLFVEATPFTTIVGK